MLARTTLVTVALLGCTGVHSPLAGGEPVSVRDFQRERVAAMCENMQRCGSLGALGTRARCEQELLRVACRDGSCDEPGDARRLRDACVPAERDRPCGQRGVLPQCDAYANPVE